MSREILFRGKTQDGEWIYGDLIHDEERFSSVRICIRKEYSTGTFYHGIAPRVTTAAVGQFTGLTDNNGKKVFEGDILHIRVGHGIECAIGKAIVYFNENQFQYRVREIKPYAYDSEQGVLYKDCAFTNIDEFEVIGNIHDNPELLEGGGQ